MFGISPEDIKKFIQDAKDAKAFIKEGKESMKRIEDKLDKLLEQKK